MDGIAASALDSITAPLNFLAPMAEKPVAYNYEPPLGVPARTGRSAEYQSRFVMPGRWSIACRSTAKALYCCTIRRR